MSKKYATFKENGQLLHRLDGAIHEIPSNAMELDDESWLKLTQEGDGIWFRSADGRLTKEPLPDLLPAEKLAEIQERAWRDGRVQAIEWLRNRHRDEVELGVATTLPESEYLGLLGYLQALRQWPQSSEFPAQALRPVAPEWLGDEGQYAGA